MAEADDTTTEATTEAVAEEFSRHVDAIIAAVQGKIHNTAPKSMLADCERLTMALRWLRPNLVDPDATVFAVASGHRTSWTVAQAMSTPATPVTTSQAASTLFLLARDGRLLRYPPHSPDTRPSGPIVYGLPGESQETLAAESERITQSRKVKRTGNAATNAIKSVKRAQKRQERTEASIARALRQNPDGLSGKDIEKIAHRTRATVSRTMGVLLAHGEVERAVVTKTYKNGTQQLVRVWKWCWRGEQPQTEQLQEPQGPQG